MKKLTVRLSEELHHALKVKCAMDRSDMNAVIVELIEDYVQAGGRPKPKKRK